MGHSKNSPWVEKHDRHEQRSDVSNVRGDMKKHGAGIYNWGSIGDEIFEERQVHPRKSLIMEQTSDNGKVQLLDDKQFTKLRRWSQ
ncbi:hypothetical protein INT43_001102 [Umbelopsis isabellina]|uniref:Hyaluronan/mRNA-binding protein domain-containing protein n=1 Tax=Mortierella isabellina TaxID=91625 RepID=A0A8H7PKM9_MORIS|nr:hypothetical protein INT43_001102 [Umbelopsis isabellina]